MSLTIEEVRKIARLARIELTPEEEKRHADTISAVLDYMKILGEVDTNGVRPPAQVTGLHDVVRPDEMRPCAHRTELLEQMPKVEDNLLIVPAVFNGE